uniref:Putative spermine/spermidine synthase n=1 Tax=Lutzomyia longipalpis TaxID=7200 RepID=A0A1B0CKW4_LUTLO
MNLLPKSHKEFGETEYWNRFFKQRGKNNFEWYGEYVELAELLHKYIRPADEILVVGCGNSSLSANLWDVGIKKISNIDISAVVIKQMISINAGRPGMEFQQMDATKMTYGDGKFSVVLDKGTLDALMTDDTPETLATVRKYWSEVIRCLRLGGRYICISLLQQHILEAIVRHFAAENFIVRINRCHEAELKSSENSKDGTAMPVFMVIATKFKAMPKKLLEVSLSMDIGAIQRVDTEEELIEAIRSAQKAAMVVSGLHRMSIAGHSEVSLDLYSPTDGTPRYTIYVLDQKGSFGHGRYASFIVPQGRECEWLFFTPEGRRKLLASVNFNRLAIVTMHRGQVYESWDAVKDELSASVQNLAPADLRHDEIIPYLSLGAELGAREIIHEGRSECSGDFIVEDVAGDSGTILRRLIFLSNQFVIQSEAQVKVAKKGKKKMKVINRNYLACQHHLYMTMGVEMVNKFPSRGKSTKKRSPNILLIGLGGGGLCIFLQKCLKNSNITAVEIDPAMLNVATEFFGLEQSEHLKVVIDDGINFLKEAAERGDTYDAILFDVDGKDSTVGMSCPPQAFVSTETLTAVAKCIASDGLFVLNLVCRDDSARSNAVERLKGIFSTVGRYKLTEDLNEIIYCTAEKITEDQLKKIAGEASKNIAEISTEQKLEFDRDVLDEGSFATDIAIV